MSIRVAGVCLDPPVILAPMAGITDLPFRRQVQRFGAGLVVSEMVASQEMVQSKPGVRERAALGLDGEGLTAVQLAGRDPYWIAEAARLVEANGAALIDINMGCPAKKVVGGLSGSALMREPDHALKLIDAVVGAVSVPVTLKMRLGWDDDSLNAAQIARRAEAAGIARVTIHGRTRCQFYKGQANWRAIRSVSEAVGIPVIANGDILSVASAKEALDASAAQGVMIGRGAQGAPWRLARVAAGLAGKAGPAMPESGALADLVCAHHEAMLAFYGTALGLRVARKHLGWYMDRAATPAGLRRAILTAGTPRAVQQLLQDAFAPAEAVAA